MWFQRLKRNKFPTLVSFNTISIPFVPEFILLIHGFSLTSRTFDLQPFGRNFRGRSCCPTCETQKRTRTKIHRADQGRRPSFGSVDVKSSECVSVPRQFEMNAVGQFPAYVVPTQFRSA
jgi:hypothetical protein